MKLYDVCLSFAGEDRAYVAGVAKELKARNIKVFYDRFEETSLWGKDLYTHLSDIYKDHAVYCVIFISKNYRKPWTDLERKSAQARAFYEQQEYILPARFDDTEVPGILPTTGYIDLNSHTPQEFAEIIIDKLNQTHWDMSDPNSRADPLNYNFYSDYVIQNKNHSVPKSDFFQSIPYNLHSDAIDEFVRFSMNRVLELRDKETSCWAYGSDTLFNKLYATSSVLTFLLQLGMKKEHPLIAESVDFLQKEDEISLDNRASIFFQIAFHYIDEKKILLFLDLLQKEQIKESNSPIFGSFLLPQEARFTNSLLVDTWQQYRFHKDGASFHACHIADHLLHMQSDFSDAKLMAASILDGIKYYIGNSFKNNSGFLLDLNSKPTTMTLYAYALAAALHLGLPRNWKDCTQKCIDDLKSERNLLSKCFGIMNVSYFSSTYYNPEIKELSVDFVSSQLGFLWEKRDLFVNNARDLSIWARSFIYGYKLLSNESASLLLNGLTAFLKNSNLPV